MKLHIPKRLIHVLIIIIILITITFLYLIMPNLGRKEALQPLQNVYFAHRGLFNNTNHIPENSLIAFQNAINHDYGIELDVQLTKDEVLVVFHDDDLKRICNANQTVSSLTFEELSQYTLFDSLETIPTLEEALTLINGQVPVMIELKTGNRNTQTCEKVAQALEHYSGNCCIISFNPLILKWFRENQPDILRGQVYTDLFVEENTETPTVQFLLTHLLLNFLAKPDFISANYEYLSNFSLTICRGLYRVPMAIWTIQNQTLFDTLSNEYEMLVFDSFIPNAS